MKKKNLPLIVVAFLVAFSMNLQAQINPNSNNTGPLTPIDPVNSWHMSGNSLSITTGNTLGSTNAFPVRIITNDTTRMYITPTGYFGVNTESPLQMFHVVEGNILISRTSERADGSTNGSILFGDQPSSTNPYGKYGIEYVSNAEEGYGLNFWKPYNSGGNNVMNNVLFLADNGNVGIGTNDPIYKLSVNGTILAKEIRVNEDSSFWPDFVFDKDYKLMSLYELRQFVNDYKHLPDVPSAADIDGKDVSLGEMNKILLQKIEELTLYVIDLQKQIDTLKETARKE